MRVLAKIGLSAFLLVIATFWAGSAQAADKITIGYGITNDFLPVFIANDKGMFAKHGLKPKLVAVRSSSLSPAALIGGSLDVAQMTPPNLLLAKQGGLDLVTVGGIGRDLASNPRSALITRVGITVTKPRDLIGKTVAVPGINAAMDLVLRKWLIDGGVKPSQVRIVEAPFARMGGELQTGQIDAAFEIDPIMAHILAAHHAKKAIDLLSWANPNMLSTIWGASRKWAVAHRKDVAAFRASLAEAIVYMRAHRAESQRIEKKYLHYTVSDMPDVSLGVTPKDIEFWIKVCREAGILHQKVNPASLIFHAS